MEILERCQIHGLTDRFSCTVDDRANSSLLVGDGVNFGNERANCVAIGVSHFVVALVNDVGFISGENIRVRIDDWWSQLFKFSKVDAFC